MGETLFRNNTASCWGSLQRRPLMLNYTLCCVKETVLIAQKRPPKSDSWGVSRGRFSFTKGRKRPIVKTKMELLGKNVLRKARTLAICVVTLT